MEVAVILQTSGRGGGGGGYHINFGYKLSSQRLSQNDSTKILTRCDRNFFSPTKITQAMHVTVLHHDVRGKAFLCITNSKKQNNIFSKIYCSQKRRNSTHIKKKIKQNN